MSILTPPSCPLPLWMQVSNYILHIECHGLIPGRPNIMYTALESGISSGKAQVMLVMLLHIDSLIGSGKAQLESLIGSGKAQRYVYWTLHMNLLRINNLLVIGGAWQSHKMISEWCECVCFLQTDLLLSLELPTSSHPNQNCPQNHQPNLNHTHSPRHIIHSLSNTPSPRHNLPRYNHSSPLSMHSPRARHSNISHSLNLRLRPLVSSSRVRASHITINQSSSAWLVIT